MSTNPDALPDSAQHIHTARIAVRWGDMDAAGHVNNSRFFTYFEEARIQWLNKTQGTLQSDGATPVVAHASCNFEQPVRHPATLKIEGYAEPPGETSVRTYYRAYLDHSDQQVAQGTAVLVWVSLETGSPVSVPDFSL